MFKSAISSCSIVAVVAVVLVGLASQSLLAQDERIDTRSVMFSRVVSSGADVTREFLLDRPMPLDSHDFVSIETLRGGLTGQAGRAKLAVGVQLIVRGGVFGQVVGGLAPSTGFITGRNGSVPIRGAIELNSTDALVDAVRITVGLRDQSADSDIEARIEPFADVGSMTLHFVRGNQPFLDSTGPNALRDIFVDPMSLDRTVSGAPAETEWTEYFFDDHDVRGSIEGSGVAYVVTTPMGFSDSIAPALAVVELLLDNFGDAPESESTLRLDDSRSPSTGEPVPGDFCVQSARLLSADERSRLEGREIIGARVKLVAGPGARLNTRQGATDPVQFVFIHDFATPREERAAFQRGDVNDDGKADISDGVSVLDHLFLGGDAPACLQSADTNGDGDVNLSDATFLFGHLFLGGPAPVAPFPDCGVSERESDEALGCERAPASCGT